MQIQSVETGLRRDTEARRGPVPLRASAPLRETAVFCQAERPWQFLYFLPLPQGQGSLRPTAAAAGFGAAPPSSRLVRSCRWLAGTAAYGLIPSDARGRGAGASGAGGSSS